MELSSTARLFGKGFWKKISKSKKVDQSSILYLFLNFFGLDSFKRAMSSSSIFYTTTSLKIY